ncbi:MAG TPA: hypothetical protein VNL96_09215 [Gemmatimonadaceae bacterium]|nr:hypothetical protein [Gemmatimonadaceae bacterium]
MTRPGMGGHVRDAEQSPEGSRFRRASVRVMAVQLVTLLLLWLLQERYSR